MRKLEKIKEIKDLILVQLSKVDLIPKTFSPVSTPMGIDRDILEKYIYDIENNVLLSSDFQLYLTNLQSFHSVLDDYLKLHLNEIERCSKIQYTNPRSVNLIMDLIGTKGVLNSENGLNIFRTPELHLNKLDYLFILDDHFFVVTNSDKKNYDNFVLLFK